MVQKKLDENNALIKKIKENQLKIGTPLTDEEQLISQDV